MARKRFVTSDMSIDEKIADIAAENPVAALMWPWFITGFDDWGRMEAVPVKIKLSIFPAFPYTPKDIEEAIDLYDKFGIVHKYEVDGKEYIAIEPEKYYKYQTYIRGNKREIDGSNCPAPPNPPWGSTGNSEDSLATNNQRAHARTCTQVSADERKCIPSPSPSPSPSKEREIDARARDNTPQEKSQENFDTELQKINNKAFEFGMNGVTPEFMDDAEMRLKEGTDPDLIIKALSIGTTNAHGNAGAKCRYAIKVLQAWAAEGIKTLAQWEAKNVPQPKARDKPMKTKAQEREEAFKRARDEARRILREEGVIKDAGNTG
jgi:DnaD/phage-associated family protein